MRLQAVSIDIEDWEAALSKVSMSEAVLVGLINARLKREDVLLGCHVEELRHVARPGRNWAVAKFQFSRRVELDLEERFNRIARIIVDASEDFDVDWPSTARH